MKTTTTGQKVLQALKKKNLVLMETENGYRSNSPFREGSDSNGFTLTIDKDGEHGAFSDHVSGQNGSLYDLADLLGVERTNGTGDTKRAYNNLAEYASAHHVPVEAYTKAGWKETTHDKRPSLEYPTRNGPRWRFLDGNKPTFKSQAGYKSCWYGLERAVQIAKETGQPLVICNGEPSTVAAQYYNVAATALTNSSERAKMQAELLKELKVAWTGKIIIALDCDKAGRENAPKLQAQLSQANYDVRAVNLGLQNHQDLADFCGLHQQDSAKTLGECKDLEPDQKPKRTRITSKDYLIKLASLGYSFRMNACNDQIVVNDEPMTDPIRATIRTQMRDSGFRRHLAAIEDAYTAHAYKNQFHPVKDYLGSLQWDGKPHIADLAAYFSDVDNIFGRWIKAWLVGAVAKVFECSQNYMLVLEAAQDLGKSTFAAWLGSPLPDYFIEGAVNPEDKDDQIKLMEKWIWEVGELGATIRKADRDALKFYLTQKAVTVRKPYGKYSTQKPAMASFIGTINNEAGFLNDPTGSRRFLTCGLTAIDWNYTSLDVNQVWAEAYSEYRDGYQWRLSQQEAALQRSINNRYRIDSHVLGMFLKYFDYTIDPTHPNFEIWTSSTDILQILQASGLSGNHRANLMELSAGLKELGIVKKRRGAMGWLGITRKVVVKDA